MKLLFKALFFCAAAFPACSAFSQIAVVVGAKSGAPAMSGDQVSALFLGKTEKFPGGGTAVLLDQPLGSPTRVAFYDKVAGKSESQVKAAWSRLVFSGKGSPPKEVANSAEVKKAVEENPSAVGYIEKSAVDSSVKVVFEAE